MDAPPHDGVEELKRLAGCPLRGDIADVGIQRAAERERMMLDWIEADRSSNRTEALVESLVSRNQLRFDSNLGTVMA